MTTIHLSQKPQTAPLDQPHRKPCKIKWFSNPIDLVELIYALHAFGSFGNAKLVDIIAPFERALSVQTGNFSHSYARIKQRPKEKCTFLSKLYRALNNEILMDDK